MNSSITATATEIKNNFGYYLKLVMDGKEVIILKNGNEVGRLVPKNTVSSFLTDSLTGILPTKYDLDEEKDKALNEKYENIN